MPSAIDTLLAPIPLPPVLRVTQRYDRPQVADVEKELARLVRKKGCFAALKPGQTVAITAGSRGITNLPLMIRTLVREVKAHGGVPFIVPAMGSHGGATAEGQVKLLAGLGIDERSMEAPIRSSMETVLLGLTSNGLPAHMDKFASEADAIIVINRIKAHTAFRGPIESGLQKMVTIGLGKQRGADFCHEQGFAHMAVNVPAIAEVILQKKNFLCLVGILENAYHETGRLEVLSPKEVIAREPDLLQEAWRLAPKIFFDELDVLVIDEIGKDISGTGFDTNVVGRYHTTCASGGPRISRVAALDLTDKSKGNANGIGILDFTTKRLHGKFIPEQTYPNSLTSTVPLTVKMPMVLKSDRQAIQAAVKCCNPPDKDAIRLVRIKNTNEMDEILVSEALAAYCKAHPNLEVLGPAAPFAFNAEGNLW